MSLRVALLSTFGWAAALGGCGSAPVDDPQAALAALESETGQPWTLRIHPDIHTPAFLEGGMAPVLAKESQADKIARGFLGAHAALFKMESATEELQSDGVETDELGMTHVRFAQRASGLPVLGGELSVHFDASGALVRVRGRFIPLPPVNVAPTVTADVASAWAVSSAQASRPDAGADSFTVTGAPELVVDPAGPRVAWRVEVFVDDGIAPARLGTLVDAATGEVYRTSDILATLDGMGVGVHGETQPLVISQKGSHYALQTDGSSPQETFSAADGLRLPGGEVMSGDANRWDTGGAAPGAAVDAHAFVTAVTSYFESVHGRKGAGNHGRGMHATVHYGQSFANAFFDGKQVVFGDGDGVNLLPLSGALDVVAHEFTHGVTESASKLDMYDEPGALNEGISDIFGTFVEHSLRAKSANWTIGEDIDRHPGGLRNLADPHRTNQPAHYSELVITVNDNGGIHTNCTIVGHAAYLMTNGGTNSVSRIAVKGMGTANAQRLWYRALTRYTGPSSNFRDAADATIAAATDIFGASSSETATVTRAWKAVGVL